MSKVQNNHLDIDCLNEAAINEPLTVLPKLIPSVGIVVGDECVLLDPRLSDQRGGSLSVNLHNGTWGHFIIRARGRGIVQLVAYARGVSEEEAAQAVAEALRDEAGSP